MYNCSFFKIKTKKIPGKENEHKVIVYPDWVCSNKVLDFMIRGKSFYAVWNYEKGLWSTDENDVYQLVDNQLYQFIEESKTEFEEELIPATFNSFNTGTLSSFKKYLSLIADNYVNLDEKIIFANYQIKQTDYASKRLPYELKPGSISAYEELMNTLYFPNEREKIEWAIGSIISGDSKNIQKFIVLYGEPGSGKSTILNIIQKMFNEYTVPFDAKSLVGNNNSFGIEAFRTNPLVAIQHDGDLSRIDDNSKLNSIISHENMIINEKYKQSYKMRINSFLFMGTNQAVKITDSKAGLLRRLIDVQPTGQKVPISKYEVLINQIDFELGAIANHCLNVFKKLGKNYYNAYRPYEMMYETNIIYNFMDDNYFLFKNQSETTLSQAYQLYKEYCDGSSIQYRLNRFQFRDELKSYFGKYLNMTKLNGKQTRHVYRGFRVEKFTVEQNKVEEKEGDIFALVLDKDSDNIFDECCSECKAQYADPKTEAPLKKWDGVKTHLKDIDSTKLHYVQIPNNHIVIDFDLKDGDGNKSKEKNLEAAALWKPTYSEFSKSGAGVHLHYTYSGDITKVAPVFGDGIEIKTFKGNASLRRKVTFHNDKEISILELGSLPLKEEKKMISANRIQNERGLRRMIERNLEKEFHAGTKPSIDFIDKILKDAYNSDVKYDVSDLRNRILQFAMNSTNQSEYCMNLVNQMKFASRQESNSIDVSDSDEIVFYDVEVFPNLFVIVYKSAGEDKQPVIMINPTSLDIENLMKMKLVGFNCRRYDNHILYGRYLGYTNQQLYELSQKIINDHGGLFKEAYNISYTDVYDFSNTKQSLKKWEIQLGIHHMELGLPWDKDVPEEKWQEVGNYCVNDVIATEKTFNFLKGDWTARQILATLVNGSVNDTTNQLATKFIFGNEKHPNLVYTDLSTIFPGYELRNEVGEDGKSRLSNFYRGTDVGFGGYVSAKYGTYYDVALLDIASMHPTSLILLNYFGEYTPKFADILNARLAIKHDRFDDARALMGGALVPFLNDESQREALAYALKIVINSQYGLSSSKFDVPQRDVRNVNNIVALRGALFMRTLQDEVAKMGYEVVHIKTDSIKIANADHEIISFCMDFAKQYGYTFEHEATFEKICLITDADYAGKYSWHQKAKYIGTWTSTGLQFSRPFVFKTLFSREDILFEDLCETKSVKTALYLNMDENMILLQKELDALNLKYDGFEEGASYAFEDVDSYNKAWLRRNELIELLKSGSNYQFVGRIGQFCPIKEGRGGGLLVSSRGDKYVAVTGTKGYRWLESAFVKSSNKEDDIDMTYFTKMSDEMFSRIGEFTDAEMFCSDNPSKVGDEIYEIDKDMPPIMECGMVSCENCPKLDDDKYHSDCESGFDNTDYILGKGETVELIKNACPDIVIDKIIEF